MSTVAGRTLGSAGSRARNAILELVEQGVFAPGARLPGERQLAEQISVSRSVLREALASLEEEGVLESVPWRGWFVDSGRMVEQIALRSFTELARERGLQPGAQVMIQQKRQVTLDEARMLMLPPGSDVLELHRVRTLDRMPACYDVAIIALSRAPGMDQVDFTDASLYALLESVGGARIVNSDYSVRAEAASGEIAKVLGVDDGTPVLVTEEVGKTIGGQPLLIGRGTYRSDAYEFYATLYRSAT